MDNFLRVLEWSFFIALSGLSTIFVKDVVDKYLSEDTSFKQYEEPIFEHPTIVVCNSKGLAIPMPFSVSHSVGQISKIW